MRRLFLLLALTMGAAGCIDDPLAFEEEIAGTYHLLTIDGDALPVAFRDDSVRIEITAAEILMGINGVYREIDTFRTTRASGVTTQIDTFTAVWTVNANNQITLTTQTSQGPLSIQGVYSGPSTLTFDVAGFPWVFRR